MSTENSLVIKRTFDAEPARVFAAWTESHMLKQWMGPGDITVSVADVDLSVGGAFKIVMDNPEGGTHTATGHYEENIPDEKLVFSWTWADVEEVTRVSVEVRATGENQTELTLMHTGFAKPDVRDHHQEGWNGCLDKLPPAL